TRRVHRAGVASAARDATRRDAGVANRVRVLRAHRARDQPPQLPHPPLARTGACCDGAGADDAADDARDDVAGDETAPPLGWAPVPLRRLSPKPGSPLRPRSPLNRPPPRNRPPPSRPPPPSRRPPNRNPPVTRRRASGSSSVIVLEMCSRRAF